MSTETKTLSSVGFIGAGMMASAIMEGLIANKVVTNANCITCSDVWEPALKPAAAKGINTTQSNGEVCTKAKEVIVVAVKPHHVETACKDILQSEGDALIVSIAAGITLETLEQHLPGRRVIRVMPNTPCLVGQAASAFALGTRCAESDREVVKVMFGSCGLALEVKEDLLNGVTGLSGSGPAYVFEFIEALADGGVRVGLSRQDALKLAAQTVKGAAELVLETGKHPGVLKDQVCSPGGTTIAGVDELEKGGLRSTAISAVKAATRRSMQLGGISESDITQKYNL